MALTKEMTLDGVGLDQVEVDAYININAISIQFRPGGIQLHVGINVFASEQARREDKALIGVENVTIPYDPNTAVNVHRYVYTQLKLMERFADAQDV
jgi:hypothetical protein